MYFIMCCILQRKIVKKRTQSDVEDSSAVESIGESSESDCADSRSSPEAAAVVTTCSVLKEFAEGSSNKLLPLPSLPSAVTPVRTPPRLHLSASRLIPGSRTDVLSLHGK